MQTSLNTIIRCAIAGAAILVAGAAQARNDKLLLPLEPALRSQTVRQVLAADVQLRFGKASAQGMEVLSTATAHAVADPFGGVNYNSGGARSRRPDEAVCLDAFRKAVLDLQQKARQTGAAGVVGIVSNYNNVEMDSAAVYECHIGHTRGVVDLKGQLVRAVGVAAAAPAVTARTAPVQSGAVVMAPQPPVPQAQFIATGYAALEDVDAVPYLGGRGAYKEYVTRPTPKAFAISPNGHWFLAYTLTPPDTTLPTDPTERALVGCQRSAQVPCKLYAINGSVVWTKDAR